MQGWNNTDVSIALTVTDNTGGSGVAQVTYSAAGAQTITRGREIHIPAESLLTFRLERPLRFVEGPDTGYTRDGRHYHDYRDDRR